MRMSETTDEEEFSVTNLSTTNKAATSTNRTTTATNTAVKLTNITIAPTNTAAIPPGEASTTQIEDSIADVFAPMSTSNVDENVEEDAVVNVDENVDENADENADGNINENDATDVLENIGSDSDQNISLENHPITTTWTPTESPDFTVSDFFKSPSTFKRRPAQREQPMRDAMLETCSLQGQLDLETIENKSSSQPQAGNRSDSGQSQRAQRLEQNNDQGAKPHLTKSRVGNRAKSCPSPGKGRPGGPLGNKSRE
jgi:hypothetical protein